MNSFKSRVQNLAINSALFANFIALLQVLDDHSPDILRILTYHRVDDPRNNPQLYPGLSITPAAFTAQMEYLSTSSYQLISAQELISRLTDCRSKPLPPRSVLVTFDDAYQDFQEFAWPILQRLKMPAVLFVPTGFPDKPKKTFWWDTLYQILSNTKKQSVLTPVGDLLLENPQQKLAVYKHLCGFLTSLPHTETLKLVDYLSETLEISPAKIKFFPGKT